MGTLLGMSRRNAPLPEWANEPFRSKDAQAKGVGRGRLRGKDLSSVYHGVRVQGPAGQSVLARCAVYAERMAPGQFFSHWTAARIHALPLPYRDEALEPLHVCVYQPDRAPRVDGVLGHHTQVHSVRTEMAEGWFVADPVSTFRQLAAELTLVDLVIMGDAMVSTGRALATVRDLQRAAAGATGMRGIVLMRAAADLVRVGSESPQETRLRLILVGAGLPEPELNTDIHSSKGAFVARGDLVYRQFAVLVEYDGEQHRSDTKQYQRDVDRLEALGREGWTTIRVLNHHMKDEAAIIRRVQAALAARGWRR